MITKKWWAPLTIGVLALAACGTESADTTDDAGTVATTVAEASGPTTFTVEIANLSDSFVARAAQVFNTPVDESEPGPAGPGSGYSASFAAVPGERLSFVTMFVQTNDWFFAPDPEGVELFDDEGNPVTGDITDHINVWDGGTEVDQTPGEGADQAPRQDGPDTGEVDPDSAVRLVEDRRASAYVSVSLEYADGEFTLTIDNVSANATTPTPLSPGVVVIHGGGEPLFSEGVADFGYGLEAIAEDGDPSALFAWLETVLGATTPLSPGVALVHKEGVLFFESGGTAGSAPGLEALAEDGSADEFAASTGGIVFAVPDGASEPGVALPGGGYTFEVEAEPGYRLSFATMFVQSNDWFFTPGSNGLALFDDEGNPVMGDVTGHVTIWDAGTEVDQTPGVGVDQAPRQAGPDTGADDEDDSIRLVEDRNAARYIQVRITPSS